MKKLLAVSAILFVCSFSVSATTMDFYTDGQIVDGDNYSTVNIWNDATVDMTGGTIETGINVCNTSTLNMFDGDINNIGVYNNAIMHLYGGSITGTLGLTPGTTEEPTVHIYGKNLNFTFDGGATGWLSGNWEDGTSFTIYCRSASASYLNSHLILHTIPEPCMIGLISFGIFFLRRKTKNIS